MNLAENAQLEKMFQKCHEENYKEVSEPYIVGKHLCFLVSFQGFRN